MHQTETTQTGRKGLVDKVKGWF